MLEGFTELESLPTSLRNEMPNLIYFWIIFEDALIQPVILFFSLLICWHSKCHLDFSKLLCQAALDRLYFSGKSQQLKTRQVCFLLLLHVHHKLARASAAQYLHLGTLAEEGSPPPFFHNYCRKEKQNVKQQNY